MNRAVRAFVRAGAELAEAVRIALESLVGARLRSFLTTLGIVIGVMTVIAIVAIIQGLNRSFEGQIANLGANTLYVSKFAWLAQGRGEWWEMRNRKDLGKRELAAVEREVTLATAVAPQAGTRGTVTRLDKELSGVQLIGTNARYLDTGAGSVQAGRFLTDTDVDLERAAAVLGYAVAERLFPGASPETVLGQRVTLEGHPFTVVGVMAKRGQMLGMDMDSNVILPFTTFLRDLGSKRSLNLAVAAAPENLSALEDQIVGVLRRVRQVAPDKKDDFAINRQEQFLRIYRQLTGALYGVAIGVGLITLVVGGIGIMNIMLVSVTERTREIGVRRALGARRRTILLQFLIESSVVAALGGAVGTTLGLGVAQLVALLTPLAAAVTPSAVALGLGFSAGVGLLFGSWPAWRAARLDPVEALRYE
ncbi:ABC transporter permease [Anaeromyxobacter dehalogenans]|uniref:ABC transporter, inner membrane subunit n=1 Tax=Anaeromyxobacter dehalogenans (strain 2CP-C) TaxID=290397 RepID=Q2IH62_ANADE|nr:ABC transporter permease [Anaeromyxobacter dehalogenans]ABC83920.1 ABC transporter, inner membrane subunit [Anaeromyxobacter dehalogenans 2CP-C]